MHIETVLLRILVPVQNVLDDQVKARVKSDGSGVEPLNVKLSMNPFDEFAVEQAERLKDSKVIVAINKASEAPMFAASDDGLESDMFTAVPEWVTALGWAPPAL